MAIPEKQYDLKTPEGVKEYMLGCKGENEWELRGDEVVAANSGYPSFWFSEIMEGGIAAQVREQEGWLDYDPTT